MLTNVASERRPLNRSPSNSLPQMDRKQLVIQALAKAKSTKIWPCASVRETVHRIAKLKRRTQVARPSQNRTRRRARQIWQENDWDEEFWLQAERELRETEELARRTVIGK
jgi:hypothetical protein